MKTSKFTDSQIMSILKQAESGTPVATLCREHGMSNATFYKWRAKYGGMDTSLMARLKELEAENTRLKKMYAEERLKAEIIQEAMAMSSTAAQVAFSHLYLSMVLSVVQLASNTDLANLVRASALAFTLPTKIAACSFTSLWLN